MNLFKVLPLLLSLLAVRGQDDDMPDFDEVMGEMDANKDGQVSWDEMFGEDLDEMPDDIKAQYKDVYKECDTDSDGLISREELPKLFEKMNALEDAEDEEAAGNDEI
mmetsp:Transcript_64054/g.101952  ORF Transcript_64054/g.101952 Transcript_64054/m.101952 type:complete len:107 (+) Transcript_64054:65-385(+)